MEIPLTKRRETDESFASFLFFFLQIFQQNKQPHLLNDVIIVSRSPNGSSITCESEIATLIRGGGNSCDER